MATKVLIEVRGGLVQAVSSTDENIEILICDWDNNDNGSSPVGNILRPDRHFKSGEAYKLYTDSSDPAEMEVRDELKAKHF